MDTFSSNADAFQGSKVVKKDMAFIHSCFTNDVEQGRRVIESSTTADTVLPGFEVPHGSLRQKASLARPPIHVALDYIRDDDIRLLKLLVEHGGGDLKSIGKFYYKCSPGVTSGTPLAHAVAHHQVAAAKYLLEAGGPCCLQASLASREVILKLVGRSLNLEIMRLFCDRDDISVDDRTVMFYAALTPSVWPDEETRERVAATPGEGAGWWKVLGMQWMSNFNPFEVLLEGAYTNDRHLAGLDYLLGRGVSPSALAVPHYPAKGDPLGVYRVLLRHGWRVNATDFRGWTALHRAANLGAELAVFDLLVEHGADLHAEADDGSLPLHVLLPAYQDTQTDSLRPKMAPKFSAERAIRLVDYMVGWGVDINHARPKSVATLGNNGWERTFMDILAERRVECVDVLVHTLRRTGTVFPSPYILHPHTNNLPEHALVALVRAGLHDPPDLRYLIQDAVERGSADLYRVAVMANPGALYRVKLYQKVHNARLQMTAIAEQPEPLPMEPARDDEAARYMYVYTWWQHKGWNALKNLTLAERALCDQCHPASLGAWCVRSIRLGMIAAARRRSILAFIPQLPIPTSFRSMVALALEGEEGGQ